MVEHIKDAWVNYPMLRFSFVSNCISLMFLLMAIGLYIYALTHNKL